MTNRVAIITLVALLALPATPALAGKGARFQRIRRVASKLGKLTGLAKLNPLRRIRLAHRRHKRNQKVRTKTRAGRERAYHTAKAKFERAIAKGNAKQASKHFAKMEANKGPLLGRGMLRGRGLPRLFRRSKMRKLNWKTAEKKYAKNMRKAGKADLGSTERQKYLDKAENAFKVMKANKGIVRGRGTTFFRRGKPWLTRGRALRVEKRKQAVAEYKYLMENGDTKGADQALRRVRQNTAFYDVPGHIANLARSGRAKSLRYDKAYEKWNKSLEKGKPSAKAYRDMRENTGMLRFGRKLAKMWRFQKLRRYEKKLYNKGKAANKKYNAVKANKHFAKLDKSRETRGAWSGTYRGWRIRAQRKKADKTAWTQVRAPESQSSFESHVALVQAYAVERGDTGGLTAKQTRKILRSAKENKFRLPTSFEPHVDSVSNLKRAHSNKELTKYSKLLKEVGTRQTTAKDKETRLKGSMNQELAKVYEALGKGDKDAADNAMHGVVAAYKAKYPVTKVATAGALPKKSRTPVTPLSAGP